MDASAITVVVLTYNEQPNIGRILERLRWFANVLVIDSGSTDQTLETVQSFPNTRILHRPFDDFARQLNFALDQVRTDWVLSLNADFLLTEELLQEIAQLQAPVQTVGYWIAFRYCIEGKPLRGTLYPDRVALFRPAAGRYIQDGHADQLEIAGPLGRMRSRIWHDDRKPITRWLAAQDRYAREEVDKLLNYRGRLGLADRLRRWIWPAPIVVFFYTLFVKRALFDGWRGWYYTAQRVLAELLLSLRLAEARIRGKVE